MKTRIFRPVWRNINLALVLIICFSPLASVNAQNQLPPPAPDEPSFKGSISNGNATPEEPFSQEAIQAKLDPYLLTLSKNSLSLPEKYKSHSKTIQKAIVVNLMGDFSPEILQALKPFFVDQKLFGNLSGKSLGLTQGGQILSGLILPYNLMKVASFPQVQKILNTEPVRMEFEPYPADDTQEKHKSTGTESILENQDTLLNNPPAWQDAKVIGDGYIAPTSPQAGDDWFEMSPMGPVGVEAAWERGFMGQGVKVAIIDDGIDFAHPDIIGAQAIYSSTINTHLNGWPIVMDPFTLRSYYYDMLFGTTYVSGGFPGVTLVDTSATPTLSPCGTGIKCFNFTPLIAYNTPGTQHNYKISTSMSLSGVIHVGTHHDESLRDYPLQINPDNQGLVTILVTDPNTAGVYDTVYVDLNNDYNFQDEKPLTKADPSNPSTYNNMVSYRDLNLDGKADLNGGLLYFIADGVHYVPTTDWLFGFPDLEIDPPAKGSLIGLHGPWDSGYSHGTQCASNVVGSGQIDGYLPEFIDLDPYPGTAAGAVYGAAPEASLVAMNASWGYTGNVTYRDAYLLAAIGWDGVDQNGIDFLTEAVLTDTDAIQITTNSYGFSQEFNDGWDDTSLIIEDIQRNLAPSLQFLFSTGNGGPGYGTAAPPSPGLGIAVGASTEYGSTGWDTITYTQQINYNDVAAFSNSGPGAREGAGVDVVAGGAYAAGAEELNYYAKAYFDTLDGNISWSTWGGTSRSSPVAAGVLALIYQAYKDKHGVWPTNEIAKSILMASSTDIKNDVFKQGAGAINADKGTALANGLYGVYPAEGSATWIPGDYRGLDAQSFTHLVSPGSAWQKTFTLRNDSPADVTVELKTNALQLINQQEFTYTVTPEMIAAESAYGESNRDNFYRAFNFFIPLHGFGTNDRVLIPDDADLMIIRQVYDYDQFDIDHNYAYDNRFYLTAYNWMDFNGDGNVWEDLDSNGVVNFINDPDNLTGIDQGEQLVWDDPRTELDRWEYSRFGYNRPNGNTYELSIQDPLNRSFDGIFIGLRHLYTQAGSNVSTTLKYRVEFYQRSTVDWLALDLSSTTIPANTSATFGATANIPADIPPGTYSAAIEVYNPGDLLYLENTIVIPVTLQVAATLTDHIPTFLSPESTNTVTIGGETSYNYDQYSSYNNGALRGYFDWSWREESGDWRNFYLDLQSTESTSPYTAHVILRDEWELPAPATDIDTIILGPTEHSSKAWTAGLWDFNTFNAAVHGPYNLETVARSLDDRAGRSIWRFNTSSNANEEWLFFPFEDGLYEIMQHNVLFQGDEIDKVFTKTLGVMYEDVSAFDIDTYYNQGLIGDVNLFSTIDLNGLQTDAYLIRKDIETFIDEPLSFTGPGTLEYTYIFPVENAVSIELTTSSEIADLDLYLFFWDGSEWVQRGASTSSSSSERIYLPDPEDGNWFVGIDNYSGPSGSFNMEKELLVRNSGITATIDVTGPIHANTPVSIHVTYDAELVEGKNSGLLIVGPPEAPHLKTIPITINKLPMKQAWVEKTVDYDLHFPGDFVHYTLELFNTFPSDQISWELSDEIPDLTSYIDANIDCEGSCGTLYYDPVENKLTFNGILPTSNSGLFTSFEDGGAWPDGWTRLHLGETDNEWSIFNVNPYSGAYAAFVRYDSSNQSDEWLFTPEFAVTEEDNQASFYIRTSTEWPDATLKLHVTDTNGSVLATLWDLIQDETWNTLEYRQKVISLADYAGQNIKLAWQYIGKDGESVYLDNVSLPGVLPAASIDLLVQVEEDPLISGGQTITNTVLISGTAVFPQEEQFLLTKDDQISMLIGQEDMSTSYKSAPISVEIDGTIEYQIHLVNTGEGIAFVQLTDPIPTGTTYSGHEPGVDSSFSFNVGLNQMEWNSSISPGEEKILTFWVTANEEEGFTIINDAYLIWNSGEMHLIAETYIGVLDIGTFLPLIIK